MTEKSKKVHACKIGLVFWLGVIPGEGNGNVESDPFLRLILGKIWCHGLIVITLEGNWRREFNVHHMHRSDMALRFYMGVA
jgi:hypothetical protein